MSLRALAKSRVVPDSISTSRIGVRGGLASAPVATEMGRTPDVEAMGGGEVAPRRPEACWREGEMSDRTISGNDPPSGLNRSSPEGLGRLGREPPARAAPRVRLRR